MDRINNNTVFVTSNDLNMQVYVALQKAIKKGKIVAKIKKYFVIRLDFSNRNIIGNNQTKQIIDSVEFPFHAT